MPLVFLTPISRAREARHQSSLRLAARELSVRRRGEREGRGYLEPLANRRSARMSLATTTVLVFVCATCGGLWLAALIVGLRRSRVHEIAAGALCSTLCLSAVVVLSLLGWFPSTADKAQAMSCKGGAIPVASTMSCPPGSGELRYHYCEAFYSKQLRQPLNTASDLGFVASGMWIFCSIGMDGRRRAGGSGSRGRTSPMASRSAQSIGYAIVVIVMGPASMLMHASMKSWAGYLDAMSVIAWAAFGLCYTTSRFASLKPRSFWALWICALLLAAIPSYLDESGTLTTVFQVAYGLGFFVMELAFQLATRSRSWAYLAASSAVISVSLVLWALSGAVGFQACRADSAFQGHMVFHLGAALTTYVMYLHYRCERQSTMSIEHTWLTHAALGSQQSARVSQRSNSPTHSSVLRPQVRSPSSSS
jgi:hypothetical protein